MRFRSTVLCLLSALLLAGCLGEVLDFRNAEVSEGKLYKEGANKPFSGKVTNVPYAQMPKAAWMEMFIVVAKTTEEKQLGQYLGKLLCDAEFDQGVLDGDTVCTLRGSDEPFMTLSYEQGSLEGAMKVKSYKVKGVTLVEAVYKGNVLEGELIVNHPETGQRVSTSHWRAGKPHGLQENYSVKTGKLVLKAMYVDGLFDGEVLTYYADGHQLVSKAQFAAGKRHGVVEVYDPDGRMSKREEWVEDRRVNVELWNEKGQSVDYSGRVLSQANGSSSQQAAGQSASAGSLTGCVDGWTAAFRKENGQEAMVTMDQLGEWEAWCKEGKVRP
jgi:antitoxin component YwqK of YwqJK toxin-antitoxin module